MDILNEIKEFLGNDWEKTGDYIENALKSDIPLLDSTNRAILSNSGKQLRPMLALLAARACSGGKALDDSCRYAAGAELLHNATLLHDDVADDSDKRRGKPTIRSVMGPSVSVLIGDYWLVKAVDMILECKTGVNRAIRLFSRTLSDLAEGELFQLQKARAGDTDKNDYLRIIFNKTASLFEAAAVSAAISVNAPEDMETAVKDYAIALGIAFQIRDDIFDYSPEMDTGKPAGADIMEQKITMPLLGAFARAGKEKEMDIRKKICCIADDPERYHTEILDFVHKYNGVDYAGEVLEQYVEKAVRALDRLEDTQAKEYLARLADFVAKRNS